MANRGSGLGRGRHLVETLVAELTHLGFRAEIAWTPEARGEMVAAAAGDSACRCLVAVGGDGTVSALLNERPRPPVTVLPAGTENLVARHFGLRRDPRRLAATIAAGRASRIDVGKAAGRRFLLMAGFGFDAEVVTRHHRARVSRSGRVRPTHRMAYVEPILRSSWSYRFPTISVRVLDPGAEEVIRGTTVFVFNLPRYALGLPFAPIARDDDGWLDLVVFRNPGPFQALYYLCKVFCGIHLDDPSVFHRRVRTLVVTADEPIPVQLDGDPGGYLRPRGDPASAAHPDEWTISILPAALTVLTPADRQSRGTRTRLPNEDVA
ncbi:MAG TPA: diacylglycerol kinase family protein [Isosphaeraceae bacterium]|nr:diacylglycerol kinase family protein [Isosphaeraceae bacterium]